MAKVLGVLRFRRMLTNVREETIVTQYGRPIGRWTPIPTPQEENDMWRKAAEEMRRAPLRLIKP